MGRRQHRPRASKWAFDANWLADIARLSDEADRPPFPLTDDLPTSYAVSQPRGERVTYFVPYEFDEVYHVRRGLQQTRDRLAHLRDLADALGATTAPNRPVPVLVLPEPNGVDSAGLAATRWAALREAYPGQPEDYPDWEVPNFPDPARTELAARLQKSFAAGVRHVHKLMKLQDTKEGWKAMAAALSEPVYREWGRLLHLLARLQNPAAPNPVTELTGFLSDLDTKVFELDPRALNHGPARPDGGAGSHRAGWAVHRHAHARTKRAGDREICRGQGRHARQRHHISTDARGQRRSSRTSQATISARSYR